MVNIGERVRQRREQLNWSIVKLATMAEMTASSLSRAERGEVRFSEENLYKVAGLLGIAVEKLYAAESNVMEAPSDFRAVPVLDYVQAGQWSEIQQNLADADLQEMIPINFECPPSTFALRIRGDSMETEFKEGDIVVINPTLPPRPGDCVVAVDEDGEATFKKFRAAGVDESGHELFELIPLNPFYAPLRSDRQKIAIVGVMIEHRRYRRGA